MRGSGDIFALEFFDQRGAVDTKETRSLSLVAIRFFDSAFKECAFKAIEGVGHVDTFTWDIKTKVDDGRSVEHALGEVITFNESALFHDAHAFQEVFKFTDVSRPLVAFEERASFVCDAYDIGVVVGVVFLDEEVAKGDDILGVITKRWEFNGEDIESVEEILAEGAKFDGLFEVGVCGCDDAKVDLGGLSGADGCDHAILQDTQEFNLEVHGHFGDLIKEERAAIGGLK